MLDLKGLFARLMLWENQAVADLAKRATALPAAVLQLWNRDFEDFRIIFEQSGHVHYFYIHGKTQQKFTRIGMIVTVLFSMLFVSYGALWWKNIKLEASHQKVYEALLSSTQVEDAGSMSHLSENQMIELANSIRERDSLLKEYISETEGLVAQANKDLSQQLLSTGLQKQRLSSSGAAGGMPRGMTGESASLLLKDQTLIELEKNRRLKEVLASLPKSLPMTSYEFSSGYGVRLHPVTGKPDFHSGLDMRPGDNAQVNSTMAGKVVLARYNGNYGNTVIIDHGQGIQTLYAHLSKIQVNEGEQIGEGKLLGVAGNSGMSTGVHLHYEIIVDNKPINPAKVIASGDGRVRI